MDKRSTAKIVKWSTFRVKGGDMHMIGALVWDSEAKEKVATAPLQILATVTYLDRDSSIVQIDGRLYRLGKHEPRTKSVTRRVRQQIDGMTAFS